MSKEKLEKDFQDFNLQIEKLAEEELKRIKEKAEAVKAQARRVGEAFENSAQETNQSGKQKG
ncbi:MAG TPA: hypothetical protein VJY36_07745 [Candidatus Bathyarchaeia archaeon]|jgi:hypothetical protein|nr:hypothetical protein [Candidatus Bathyarchaeia archaeon]